MRHRRVRWSIDTRDYQGRRASRIAAQVLRQVKPGAIIILHDGGGNRAQTVAALRLLLPRLREDGYRMVTVSQLLALGEGS